MALLIYLGVIDFLLWIDEDAEASKVMPKFQILKLLKFCQLIFLKFKTLFASLKHYFCFDANLT